MQAAFVEAVVNRGHRVLGRRLHDFCLYDAIALSLADNPLWTGGDTALTDLEQAVLICSLPPERFLRAQLAPRNWIERLGRWLWKRTNRRRIHALERGSWNAYIEDFYALPDYWDCADGKPLRAPWLYGTAVFLEKNTNMTEREICTAPIGKMFWKAAILAERLGIAAAELMTDEEIAIGKEQQAALTEESSGARTPAAGSPEGSAEALATTAREGHA